MKYVCFHEKKMNLALWVLPSSPCLAMSTSNKHSDRGPLISFSRTANRARKVIQSSCPSYKEGKKSCPLDSISPIELLACFFPVWISLTRTTCQNEHPVGDQVGTPLALPASRFIAAPSDCTMADRSLELLGSSVPSVHPRIPTLMDSTLPGIIT